jgi:hypothetical protein
MVADRDNWSFPGSRWWKADLHSRTPASDEFPDPEATADESVKAVLAAGMHVLYGRPFDRDGEEVPA